MSETKKKKPPTKSTKKSAAKTSPPPTIQLDPTSKVVWFLVLIVVVGAFFLGYTYGQLRLLNENDLTGVNRDGDVPAQADAPTEPEVEITDELWQELLTSPAAETGDPDAAVTLVEFTDYECPFCQRHFEQTDRQIVENYVDTGKIRYIARDLPLPFHPNASLAAQAARCAGDQDSYWKMRELLFENQQVWSQGDAESLFTEYATEVGLNLSTYTSCMDSEKYAQAVEDDLALASKVGATGTPTFFVNGTKIVGAQPFQAFEQVIESAL